MAFQRVIYRGNGSERGIFTALSTDTKGTDTTEAAGSLQVFAGDWCFETDGNKNKFEFVGNTWVQISTGGADNTRTVATDVQFPAGWHTPSSATAADTSAGTAIYASIDVSTFNKLAFTITTAPTTGINIFGSYDGTTFQTASTDRLTAIDKTTGAIVTGATLATTTAGSFAVDISEYKKIEIRQVGAGTAGAINYALKGI